MSSLERAYRKLVAGSGTGAAQTGVPALKEDEPRNFFLFVASHFLTKLGDALSNPKTTLTWLAGSLGVAGWMTVLLVPLRESGSMLVQIGLAGFVERFRQRKWVWSLGALLQAASMLGIAAVALWLRGYAAGLVLLALLAVFALSRSLSSVASKDVLGRILPKSRRGRANGWAASTAGVATLGIGALVIGFGPDSLPPSGYAAILAFAGGTWVLGALLFYLVREPEAGGSASDTGTRLRMLFRDRRLRHFVVARAWLMCTALSAPYYVMLAHRHAGETPRLLAVFVTAEGVASMLGGPLWGRLADHSSRHVMLAGGLASAVLSGSLAMITFREAGILNTVWFMPAMYFLLSLAHQAVRIGRKTYVVDMAEGDTRTDYVAVSNSAIGVLLLVGGGAIAAISIWSVTAAFVSLAVMGIAGTMRSAQLPPAAPT